MLGVARTPSGVSEAEVERLAKVYWDGMMANLGETAEPIKARLAGIRAVLLARESEAEKKLALALEALKPFAEYAERYTDPPGSIRMDDVELWQDGRKVVLTIGHLRRAAAAVKEIEGK